MPLRCSALLSCSAAMHRTAIPRPSCSSLSYAIAKLSPALLLLWISAPCVLCLSSAIPSSSMLLLCGRSVAMLCRRIVPLCYAIAIQFRAFPSPCKSIRGHAFAVLVASDQRRAFAVPRVSDHRFAFASLVASDQRRAFALRRLAVPFLCKSMFSCAFADRGSASLLLCPRKS